MKSFFQHFLALPQWWMKQSLVQKITLLFAILLFVFLFFVPIFSVRSISDDSVQTIWLFHSNSIKTCILFVVYWSLFFLWNFSLRFRNRCYIVFWFQAPQPFISFCILATMLCYLLVISDVVLIVKEYLSRNMELHWGYIVLVSLLFFGMLRQLMIARLQWKQKIQQQEIHIHKHEHAKKPGFDSSQLSSKTLF